MLHSKPVRYWLLSVLQLHVAYCTSYRDSTLAGMCFYDVATRLKNKVANPLIIPLYIFMVIFPPNTKS